MWFLLVSLATRCSASNHTLRIYGGTDAKPDEYPYVVRIEIHRFFWKNNRTFISQHHLCSASALSSEWVLSAAHCVENIRRYHHGPPFDVEKILIRHGDINKPWDQDSFSDVLLIVAHPLFSANLPPYNLMWRSSVKHDISLLKTSPMNIQSYVKLSAVDYRCFYGHEVVMAGFGKTSKTLADGKIEIKDTLHLKKPLQVLKVIITKCEADKKVVLGLCLASTCDRRTRVCSGDSGGPFLHPSGVIGVLSMGPLSKFCFDPTDDETITTFGLITPVSPYIEWIYGVMKGYNMNINVA